ncbi:EAL domain-containing protein [Paraburkholderia unamae]|uniref:EAL domain-containing protein (Putative c-di-GMP-specific phosphodiesterase class I) n=1 Tax=Paraburkholderia unamae TaxID=219649 RepID=A0ABX5KP08_9BURK|nr:EAL domain-containing protein [Paraburkholderia unamae]PVX84228.1 EAL domain-containing protein (putative c-di-GMP-specific phosphodiesterase class I) [Paraburkholderia unamae]RAR59159.1 EAL domain-containing protein (putative c-di-GMP-specific phosphodiesterase class I) [Paraburkholderia unamae]
MKTLIGALQEHAAHVVNRFYEELGRLPKSRRILEMLSGAELAHLKSRQIQNLLALANLGLTAREHAEMAQRIGRIHAIVGLDKEELVRSRGILQELLYAEVGRTVSAQQLSLYTRRLTSDLAWQLKAYQDVQDSQQEALLRITRLVWEAGTYTNFIDQVIATLAAHGEVTACTIGRPDAEGIFHFEAGSGGKTEGGMLQVLVAHDQVISVRADHPQGQGAVARAWRSGKPERVVNYQTDPLVTAWREVAAREGVRSSVAIPLAAPGQPPLAVLSLYSAFPGGFVGPEQVAFVDLLQTLLGCAAMRIPIHDGMSAAVPVSVRQHWAALVRTGALQMHYQPLLNLSTGRAEKVEALARLRDGERLLVPDDFLSALSSDDLLALFTSGLDQALADRARWRAQGRDLDISINLPPAALNDIRYFEATRGALVTHGCPAARLTLEVLENEALSLIQGQRGILAKFRELGVLLAQDDLGAGHSGLTRLRELPFDWIKLDREMVKLSGGDALNTLRVIYQLTRLGHSLGRQVLAEGVDTLDLLHALAILGVDGAQGFGIAKPMEGARLLEWLDCTPDFVASVSAEADAGAGPGKESLLARLARFVIWEERMLMIAALPQASRDLLQALTREDGEGGGVPLAQSLAGFGNILPPGPRRDALHRQVVGALLAEGAGSEAWRNALRALMEAITGDA